MTSTRRRKRGKITIRPVLQTRVETAFDYYRRKALAEFKADWERLRAVSGHSWHFGQLQDPDRW